MAEKTYSVKQAAIILGTTANTLRSWIRDGEVAAFRSGPREGSPYRIREDEVQRVLEIQGKSAVKV